MQVGKGRGPSSDMADKDRLVSHKVYIRRMIGGELTFKACLISSPCYTVISQ